MNIFVLSMLTFCLANSDPTYIVRDVPKLKPVAGAPNSICVKLDENANGTGVIETLQALGYKWTGEQDITAPYITFQTPVSLNANEAIRLVRSIPGVKMVSSNHLVRLSMMPDDPYCGNASDPANYYYPNQWYSYRVRDVSAGASALNITTGSPDIIIAVVDSGVDMDSPELFDRVISGYDFVGDDPGAGLDDYPGDPNPDIFYPDPSVGNGIDDNGDGYADLGVSHGTTVAGVIGSRMGNRNLFCGLAPNCRILVVRAFNPEGTGWESDIALGIRYAADNGANIINCSFGSSASTQIILDACDYARAKGALVIAASGNSASSGYPDIEYPAAYEGVVAVGATDPSGNRASFSCYGRQLDIAAPGEYIWSLYVTSYADYLSGYGTPGSATLVSRSDGTSLACPIVSAGAALLASQALPTQLTRDELEALLMTCGENYPSRDNQLGYGEIDFMRGLDSRRQPSASTLSLGNPYPNPFKPGGLGQQQISLPLANKQDGQVKVGIYDVSGRLVHKIYDSWMLADDHTLSWDGRDGVDNYAVPGVYILRAVTGKTVVTRNILVTR